MRAAIYARKSTEQNDVQAEDKSVAVQVEQGRAFAQAKGWTVVQHRVEVDDAISGAEFVNRPGLLRLQLALRPKPDFDVLLVRDLDRIGRESIETSYVLKQFVDAGVTVIEYSTGKELLLDSPTDKLMLAIGTFGGEQERAMASARTRAAMVRLVQQGRSSGGTCYGYDVISTLKGGKRVTGKVKLEEQALVESVVWEINPAQAEVVTRIFQLFADGHGRQNIAKILNGEGIKAATGKSWDSAVVRQIIHRDVYRGVIVWGKSKRVKRGGTSKIVKVTVEPIVVERPELRIVSDLLWDAAHARRKSREAGQLRAADGKLAGHPTASPYLLTRLSKCGVCGSALFVKKGRTHIDGSTAAAYKCIAARSHRCQNTGGLDVAETDKAVLQVVEHEILQADAINRTLDLQIADAAHLAEQRDRLKAEIAALDAEIGRLVDLAASGSAGVLAGLKSRETKRADLAAQAEHVDGQSRAAQVDRQALAEALTDWRKKLSESPLIARQILSKLLPQRLTFDADGTFYGPATFGAIFAAGGRQVRPQESRWTWKPDTIASPSVQPRSKKSSTACS
jgi:site-specific DNA recombinase